MPNEPIETPLEKHMREKQEAKDIAHDVELRARMTQVQVLQCLTMKVGLVKCPHCGATLVDPRPKANDEDYDTRM